jgi:quercetin dioxygenase-like cupin family protein
MALVAHSGEAAAQPGGSPVKVDTKGLVAKIKFEASIGGFLNEINGKYKLRVTELTLAPGGYVGEHNHVGPGIRQVTSGYMTYVLPKETIVYGPGDFFFETVMWKLKPSEQPLSPRSLMLRSMRPSTALPAWRFASRR